MSYTLPVAFDTLLADLSLTDRQKEIAAGRVNHLVTYFSSNVACAKLPFEIGSYQRGTVVRWFRDIDVMVALDYPTYKARYDHDSAAMLRWLRDKLNFEYGGTTVSRREVAIRMALSDGLQVDLVPTFSRSGGGFLMPNGSGGWLSTSPPHHATLVTDANVRLGYRLKPLVRLMKGWNEANSRHLRSFHLEMMVWEIYKSRSAVPDYASAVAAALASLVTWLKYPMYDPWTGAGTIAIDSYLSASERALVGRSLEADAKRASEAVAYSAAGKSQQAYERWNVVYNGKFPAYG